MPLFPCFYHPPCCLKPTLDPHSWAPARSYGKALGWGWGGRAAKARATPDEAGGRHWPGPLLPKLLWGQGQPLRGRGDQTDPGCPLRCQPGATPPPRGKGWVLVATDACLGWEGRGEGGVQTWGSPSSTPGRTPQHVHRGLRTRATWFLEPRSPEPTQRSQRPLHRAARRPGACPMGEPLTEPPLVLRSADAPGAWVQEGLARRLLHARLVHPPQPAAHGQPEAVSPCTLCVLRPHRSKELN